MQDEGGQRLMDVWDVYGEERIVIFNINGMSYTACQNQATRSARRHADSACVRICICTHLNRHHVL